MVCETVTHHVAEEEKPLSRTSKLHFETLLFFSSQPDGSPDYVTSVSLSDPAMHLPPVHVDGQKYYLVVFKDRSRYLVHRVTGRMETSFAGLTLEQHIGYIRKATMEAPTEIEMCKVRATAARTLKA